MEIQGLRHRPRRLVLVPCAMQGHINPMIQLGTILHSKGCFSSITVAHTQLNSPSDHTSSHPYFIFQPLLSSDDSSLSSGTDFIVQLSNLNSNCEAPLQELMTQIVKNLEQNEDLPCIIYDPLMYYVKSVADHLKLPSIMFRTSCVTNMLSWYVCPRIKKQGYTPFRDFKSLELVPGLDPLRFKDLPILPSVFENLDAYLQLVTSVQNIGTSSAIIFNSMDCLEQSSLARLQQECQILIFAIGPMHKLAPEATSISLHEEDRSCITWLYKQATNSVIYASLGSIASVNEKEIAEMAWGLANSNQPFLWVIRPGLVRGSESKDPLFLPDDFKQTVGERGCIVQWAPQKQVLAHKAVGGFWSHCGWNSTIESINEGVPMICRPFFADQQINTGYISHVWRIGIELENDFE